jgi:hypothetical protein
MISLHDRPPRRISASPSRRISRPSPGRRLCWLQRALSKRRYRSRVLGPFQPQGVRPQPSPGQALLERVATPLTTDILERIGVLYSIEAEVRGRPPHMRLAAGVNGGAEQDEAAGRCATQDTGRGTRRLSPKSDMAKAIAYGTKRWPALGSFLDDGRLEIDNNIAERALRGVADGKAGCSPVRRRAASAPQRSTP